METNIHTSSKPFTIGVLLGSFEEPCQSQMIKGLTHFAQSHHIHLVTFVGASIDESQKYLGSYQLLQDLILASNIDALIMMSGAISNLLSSAELKAFINCLSPLPIISVSMPISGCTNLLLDNETGINYIVEHLITEHDCRRIAFVSGPPNHEEADTRLKAYKETLNKHHLAIDPTIIFPGDFSIASGKLAVDTIIANQINDLDAIVCVDDLTAYGVLQTLKSYGIKVPFDIRVTGFDDSFEAQTCFPPLSTVRQPFYEMGTKAGKLALQLIKQHTVPSTIYIQTETILRESCGCIEEDFIEISTSEELSILSSTSSLSLQPFLSFIHSYLTGLDTVSTEQLDQLMPFINDLLTNIVDDKLILSQQFWHLIRSKIFYLSSYGIPTALLKQLIRLIHIYFSHESCDNLSFKFKYIIQRFTNVLDDVNSSVVDLSRREAYLFDFKLRQISQKLIASFDSEAVLTTIANGLTELGIPSCYIVLFNNHDVPNHTLNLHFALEDGIRLRHLENKDFESTYMLTPSILLKKSGITHVVMPLLPNQDCFGYIIFQYTPIAHNVFETLRSHIGSGLHGARLYEKEKRAQRTLQRLLIQLEQSNSQLKTTSIQDELTGLYNRRGFMELASEQFDAIRTHNHDCILYFIDLDGLKQINDTYGHQEGDYAIIQTATLLKQTFGEYSYIARLGGDEFTVFTPIDSNTLPSDYINSFNFFLQDYNNTSQKTYILSASLGYAKYSDHTNISFRGLLNLADLQLYKAKQKKYKYKEHRIN